MFWREGSKRIMFEINLGSGVGNVDSGEDLPGSREESGGATDIVVMREEKCSFSHLAFSCSVSFSNLVTPECHPL